MAICVGSSKSQSLSEWDDETACFDGLRCSAVGFSEVIDKPLDQRMATKITTMATKRKRMALRSDFEK